MSNNAACPVASTFNSGAAVRWVETMQANVQKRNVALRAKLLQYCHDLGNCSYLDIKQKALQSPGAHWKLCVMDGKL